MAERFECGANGTSNDCSEALREGLHKPPLKKVQSDGDKATPLPGGVTLQDLVYRYTPTKLEPEKDSWGPDHQKWERETADRIRKDPKSFEGLAYNGFMSNIVDTCFDVGTKKAFDMYVDAVNKNLKGEYKLSLRQDSALLQTDVANAKITHGEKPDFAGYLELRGKDGQIIGSIPIHHTPIPGSRLLV